jgi:ATP-binding cassette subfamily C protein LapB
VLDGGRVVADGPKEQVMQALSGGKISVAKR